eukprot:PLAT2988.1.p1 GENE.PLAT2988.1~~PLAT2988.1.p1  ORF type:complete len:963 (+),score=426.36 PLAT2988.1:284-2890(+)
MHDTFLAEEWPDNSEAYGIFAIIMPASGVGGSVLTQPMLEVATEIEAIARASFSYEGEEYTFEQLCTKPNVLLPDTCFTLSMLEMWRGADGLTNVTALRADLADGDARVLSMINDDELRTAIGISYANGDLYGDVDKDSDGNYTRIGAVRAGYFASPQGDLDGDALAQWEVDFTNEMETQFGGREDVTVHWLTLNSIESELQRSLRSDIMLFVLAPILMTIFTCAVLGKLDWVAGRKMLGCAGLLSVGLSVGMSIGLSSVLGVPFTSVTQIVPFLALGIGVDDMFILVNAFDATDPRKPMEKRMEKAMSSAGAAITMTSITNCLAFAIGATTQLPAIRYYCINLSFAVLFDFVLQVTFFAAALVLDTQRIAERRYDCAPWKQRQAAVGPDGGDKSLTTKKKGVEKSALTLWLTKYYTPLLRKTWFKVLVLLAFTGMSVAGGLSTRELRAGFEVFDVLPDDSFLKPYFLSLFNDFRDSGINANIIVDAKWDYHDPEAAADLRALVEDMQDSDYVIDDSGSLWLNDYLDWLSCYPCCQLHLLAFRPPVCAPLRAGELVDGFPPNRTAFYAWLHDFGDDALYGQTVSSNLLFDDDSGEVRLSRMPFLLKGYLRNADPTTRVVAMDDARSVAAASPVPAFAFTSEFINWEQYAIIEGEAVQNVLLAAVTVFIVTLVLLVHPGVSMLVMVAIVLIDVNLLGFMPAWGVFINVVSVANLVLAVGLAVDYCAHIAHAFVSHPVGTRDDRVVHAVEELGTSVLQGATTTFLGVVVLAFGKSEIFRIFFKMFTLTVTLGVAHGLILLPVLLSLLGGKPITTSAVLPLTSSAYSSRLPKKQPAGGKPAAGESVTPGAPTPKAVTPVEEGMVKEEAGES